MEMKNNWYKKLSKSTAILMAIAGVSTTAIITNIVVSKNTISKAYAVGTSNITKTNDFSNTTFSVPSGTDTANFSWDSRNTKVQIIKGSQTGTAKTAFPTYFITNDGTHWGKANEPHFDSPLYSVATGNSYRIANLAKTSNGESVDAIITMKGNQEIANYRKAGYKQGIAFYGTQDLGDKGDGGLHSLAVLVAGYKSVSMHVDYVKSGTNTKMTLATGNFWSDIDIGQGVYENQSNQQAIFLDKTNRYSLSINGNDVYSTNDGSQQGDDMNGYADANKGGTYLGIGIGSGFDMTYYTPYVKAKNSWLAGIEDAWHGVFRFDLFGTFNNIVLPPAAPTEKVVDDYQNDINGKDVSIDQHRHYQTTQQVQHLLESTKYNGVRITGTVSNDLDILKYKLLDKNNKDISDHATFIKTGNTVVAKIKGNYLTDNQKYTLDIDTLPNITNNTVGKDGKKNVNYSGSGSSYIGYRFGSRFDVGQAVAISSNASAESNGYNLVNHRGWEGSVVSKTRIPHTSNSDFEYYVRYTDGSHNDHVLEQDLEPLPTVQSKFEVGQAVAISSNASAESNGYNLVNHRGWEGNVVSKTRIPHTSNSNFEYYVRYHDGSHNDHVLEQDLETRPNGKSLDISPDTSDENDRYNDKTYDQSAGSVSTSTDFNTPTINTKVYSGTNEASASNSLMLSDYDDLHTYKISTELSNHDDFKNVGINIKLPDVETVGSYTVKDENGTDITNQFVFKADHIASATNNIKETSSYTISAKKPSDFARQGKKLSIYLNSTTMRGAGYSDIKQYVDSKDASKINLTATSNIADDYNALGSDGKTLDMATRNINSNNVNVLNQMHGLTVQNYDYQTNNNINTYDGTPKYYLSGEPYSVKPLADFLDPNDTRYKYTSYDNKTKTGTTPSSPTNDFVVRMPYILPKMSSSLSSMVIDTDKQANGLPFKLLIGTDEYTGNSASNTASLFKNVKFNLVIKDPTNGSVLYTKTLGVSDRLDPTNVANYNKYSNGGTGFYVSGVLNTNIDKTKYAKGAQIPVQVDINVANNTDMRVATTDNPTYRTYGFAASEKVLSSDDANFKDSSSNGITTYIYKAPQRTIKSTVDPTASTSQSNVTVKNENYTVKYSPDFGIKAGYGFKENLSINYSGLNIWNVSSGKDLTNSVFNVNSTTDAGLLTDVSNISDYTKSGSTYKNTGKDYLSSTKNVNNIGQAQKTDGLAQADKIDSTYSPVFARASLSSSSDTTKYSTNSANNLASGAIDGGNKFYVPEFAKIGIYNQSLNYGTNGQNRYGQNYVSMNLNRKINIYAPMYLEADSKTDKNAELSIQPVFKDTVVPGFTTAQQNWLKNTK